MSSGRRHADCQSPPTVLFVISVGLIAVPVLREQVTYLSARGVTVHVAAAPDPWLQEMLETEKASFHPWNVSRGVGLVGSEAAAWWSIWRIMAAIRPTVVVAGTPKAGLLGVLTGKLLRVPRVVYTLHGLRLEGARGWRRRLLWILEAISCRSATEVHAVGPELATVAIGLRLVKPGRVHVVGHGSASGVNIDRFRPWGRSQVEEHRRRLALPTDAPVIGFVGRLTHDKGLADLIELSRHLAKNHESATLVVVGEGDASHPEDAALLSRLLKCRNVKHLGRRPDMQRIYPIFDALVLPSKREGLPTVVLEAGACGVPAAIYRCTGARDAVRDGKTGIILPTDDIQAFQSAVSLLIENHDLRVAMGDECRRMVSDNFDSTTFLPLLADFYLIPSTERHVGPR